MSDATAESPETTQQSGTEPHRTAQPPHRRLLLDDNRFVMSHGLATQFWQDVYHRSLTLRWPVFFALAACFFLGLNLLFAALYLLGDHAIANQSPHGMLGAFFFSVETLATVGYGDMHPGTIYGHTVATVEIFVGMSGVALTTGMIFARFSRPHARVLFAKYPVVLPVNGMPTLMVRTANARQNVIVEATARMRLLRWEKTLEGDLFRKVYDLKLIRERHPIFLLGWNIMHVIDEQSPLHQQDADSQTFSEPWLMLMVEGVDETTMQPMQARYNWNAQSIRWQHRYVDLLYEQDGVTHVDYAKFHDVVPL
jgi:inward rectifier potassium channel